MIAIQQSKIGGMSSPQRNNITGNTPISNIIYVDSKEPDSIFSEFTDQTFDNPKFVNFVIKRKGLYCSDICYNDFGVERKTLTDFVGSIHDGRIQSQARKMFENFNHKTVYVSGNNANKNITETDWKGIYTTCADLELRYGFKVMFFPNDKILVHYFMTMCLKLYQDLKPKDSFKMVYPPGSDEMVNVLCGFSGCGRKKAIQLLTKHKTLRRIFLLKKPDKGVLHTHMYEIINKEYEQS